MLLEALVIGGLLYGTKAIGNELAPYAKTWYRQRQKREKLGKLSEKDSRDRQRKNISSVTKEHQVTVQEKKINRKVAISGGTIAVAAVGNLFYPPLALLSIPGLLYVSTDIFKSAYNSLVKERRINIDFPIIIVIIVCIAKGFLFICALNAFLAMYSRKLLFKIKGDSQNKVIDVFKQQPRKAWVLSNGTEVEMSIETLKQGDVVIVNAGETIPIDGQIDFGRASIDQHILTGESQPVEKGVNESVFALTILLSGKIGILVEKTGQETTAAQIGQILNRTINVKTNAQLWAEKTGDQAVLPALLFSGICWPVLGAGGSMAILNSHPKYKTTIATYIGILNFLSMASQRGILIKDGRVLERLNQVDTVVFDKTGTLTKDEPHIVQIHSCDAYQENEILSYAAIVERKQTHPIARAILQEVKTRQLTLSEFDEMEYKVGYGLIMKTDREIIRVGSLRFIEREKLDIPLKIREVQNFCNDQGHSLVLVSVNNKVIGGIELHATVRQEVKTVIRGLRKNNINSVYIISGDHEKPTKRLAESLGIDRYFAEVLPENKAELIGHFQEEGKTVCFIGDGINDSIALKKADVSVSLRGASTVATDTAQIILMDESLSQLCYLFELAREYESNMKTTFITVLAPHIAGLGGALFLHFGLLHSIILNHIGLALGVGNSTLPRIRHQRDDTEQLSAKSEPLPNKFLL